MIHGTLKILCNDDAYNNNKTISCKMTFEYKKINNSMLYCCSIFTNFICDNNYCNGYFTMDSNAKERV